MISPKNRQNRIREQREARGLTRRTLAERISQELGRRISEQTIMRLEPGAMQLTLAYLGLLARAMSTSAASLLPIEMTRASDGPHYQLVPVIPSLSAARRFVRGPSRRNLRGLSRIPVVSLRPHLLAAYNDGLAENVELPLGTLLVWDYTDRKLRKGRTYLLAHRGRVFCDRAVSRVPQWSRETSIIGRVVLAVINFDSALPNNSNRSSKYP